MILGIGSGKCGTSSVYDWLIQSSQVKSGTQKELQYFNRTCLSKEKYLQMAGGIDVSPDYLITKGAAKRAKELFPNAKVFCILRNPTERSWSSYRMVMKRHMLGQRIYKRAAIPFIDILKENHPNESFIEMGLYSKWLIEWNKCFDVGLFKYDDIIIGDGFNLLTDWLGLERYDHKKSWILKGQDLPIPTHIETWLNNFYRKPNQQLLNNYGIDFT